VSLKASEVSSAALAAFARMQLLESQCTCQPRNWDRYWEYELCAACEEWWRQHAVLHHELHTRPWEWPCVQHPNAANPWPAGSTAHAHWQPDVNAQRCYRQLDAVVKLGASPERKAPTRSAGA
jgi:hypothetical protein